MLNRIGEQYIVCLRNNLMKLTIAYSDWCSRLYVLINGFMVPTHYHFLILFSYL